MQENTIITILNPSNVFLKVKTILLFMRQINWILVFMPKSEMNQA